MTPITVLLVDDHAIVRAGLRRLLELETDIEVIAEARTGREAVEFARTLLPEVVVMDIAMPLLNGLEATRQILETAPSTRILILSAHGDDVYVDELIKLGVAGYLVKRTSAPNLPKAIRQAHQGKTFFSPSIARQLRHRTEESAHGARGRRKKPSIKLTPREAEVLQLVAEGSANKNTAAELGISIKTVEKHRQSLMNKLDIHDATGLTRYAIATGIIAGSVRLISE